MRGRLGSRPGRARPRTVHWEGLDIVPVSKDFCFEHPVVAAQSEAECEAVRASFSICVLWNSSGQPVPRPVTTFEQAPFPDWVAQELRRHGFTRPTPLQVQAWPIALKGHDFAAVAESGAGRTLAYILPMLVHLMAQPGLSPGEGPIGLVLVPDRDIGAEVARQAEGFVSAFKITCRSLCGGAGARQQLGQWAQRLDIAVATPGRLVMLLNRLATNLRRATFCVLDGADELLKRGFGDQARLILSQMRPDRQVLLFSATWTAAVEGLARHALSDNAIYVSIGSSEGPTREAAQQRTHRCSINELGQSAAELAKAARLAWDRDRRSMLASFLEARSSLVTQALHCAQRPEAPPVRCSRAEPQSRPALPAGRASEAELGSGRGRRPALARPPRGLRPQRACRPMWPWDPAAPAGARTRHQTWAAAQLMRRCAPAGAAIEPLWACSAVAARGREVARLPAGGPHVLWDLNAVEQLFGTCVAAEVAAHCLPSTLRLDAEIFSKAVATASHDGVLASMARRGFYDDELLRSLSSQRRFLSNQRKGCRDPERLRSIFRQLRDLDRHIKIRKGLTRLMNLLLQLHRGGFGRRLLASIAGGAEPLDGAGVRAAEPGVLGEAERRCTHFLQRRLGALPGPSPLGVAFAALLRLLEASRPELVLASFRGRAGAPGPAPPAAAESPASGQAATASATAGPSAAPGPGQRPGRHFDALQAWALEVAEVREACASGTPKPWMEALLLNVRAIQRFWRALRAARGAAGRPLAAASRSGGRQLHSL